MHSDQGKHHHICCRPKTSMHPTLNAGQIAGIHLDTLTLLFEA